MSTIAPPTKSGNTNRPVKVSKNFLSDALQSKTRQLVNGEAGVVTAAQAMAERLVNIAIYAESNQDAIAAQKLIYDRLQGKAAVIKEDDTRPMPKVVFEMTQEGLDKVNESRTAKLIDLADMEDEAENLIIAEDKDTGTVYVG